MKAELSSYVEPVRPAYQRFTARIRWPDGSDVLNPQRLGDVAKVIDALRANGVPDDAYFQTSWPDSWANWERPVDSDNEVNPSA